MSELDTVRKHLRQDHKFEGCITRDKTRRGATHEFFTPNELVDLGLGLFDNNAWLPGKTFVDNSAGDAQLLSGVVLKKIEAGCTYKQALEDIYGVEFEVDNCLIAIHRLYGAFHTPKVCVLTGDSIPFCWRSEGLKAVFEVDGVICNIVCADGLTYDYSFGTNPNEPVKTAKELAAEAKELKLKLKEEKRLERERLKLVRSQEKAKKELEKQRIKSEREAIAEEKRRLKAKSKKKNVVHKWIDEVSDLFGFK